MEAYVVEEPRGRFRKTDLPRPALKPKQVLISVKASGVNPLDTKIRAGKAEHAKQPLPAVLGVDMAGIVEEFGPEVTDFRAGDEVYGMDALASCPVKATAQCVAHSPLGNFEEAGNLVLIQSQAEQDNRSELHGIQNIE